MLHVLLHVLQVSMPMSALSQAAQGPDRKLTLKSALRKAGPRAPARLARARGRWGPRGDESPRTIVFASPNGVTAGAGAHAGLGSALASAPICSSCGESLALARPNHSEPQQQPVPDVTAVAVARERAEQLGQLR